MTPAQEAKIDRLTALLTPLAGLFYPVAGSTPVVKIELDAILAAAGGTAPADLTVLKADVAVIKAKVLKDLA